MQAVITRTPAMAMGKLEDPEQLGRVLAASGYFSDARDAAQAVVKVLAGQELGFGPIASMTGVYIVKGRVTLSANLIAAAIKRHPRYDFRVRTLDNEQAEVVFFDEGREAGTSAFTMADAKQAGLTGENWRHYPRNMLFARAVSNGAKFFCPDVFAGAPVYTPDELGAEINPETGDIVVDTATGEVIQPPQETAVPSQETEPLSEPKWEAEDEAVSAEEVAKLRELLERHGAPDSFVRIALMTHGADTLEALTREQARELMREANRRFAAS